IKSASLRWHSPMLDDISGVKKWAKVNEGMIKMYRQEVLNKLPIMQHFLFGTVLPFEGSVDVAGVPHELEHVHAFGQEKPLCCVIRVPSSIAATQNGPRPVPFD
ncbi:Serine/threonine-protein phosphatase 2A activator 2, partial [Kappamyces sp. JEL0680]